MVFVVYLYLYQWTCSNIFITAQLNHNFHRRDIMSSPTKTREAGAKFSKVSFTLAITAFKGWLSFRLLLIWREREQTRPQGVQWSTGGNDSGHWSQPRSPGGGGRGGDTDYTGVVTLLKVSSNWQGSLWWYWYRLHCCGLTTNNTDCGEDSDSDWLSAGSGL